MSSQRLNMGEGKVLSVLLCLGGPAMVSMFFQNLYALVDTVFVSWLGTNELAALSLAVPVLYIGLALNKGIAVGSTALMSHARGAGKQDDAGSIAKSVLPLALCVLGPFCLMAFPQINQPVFGLFNISDAILEQVDLFVFWLALTFPVMSFAMICEGILLSCGDAKTPMKAMIAGNVLNIALDPFLIFFCKMGIAGASLASLIGWGAAGAIMFFSLSKRNMDRPMFVCGLHHVKSWIDIVKVGAPVSLAMLVMPLSTAALNYVLTPLGPAYVGAWNLSSRMEQMVVLPLMGLSYSLIPFAGFNLGKGSSERIREAVWICIKGCYAVIVPVGFLLFFTIQHVLGVFNSASEVQELAGYAFRVALIGYCIVPFELVLVGLAQGIGRPGYVLFINASRLLALRIPLAFAFVIWWGGEGVYASHATSMMVTGLGSLFLIRHLLNIVDEECKSNRQGVG
jgi:putative MATE family efflux protein